MQDGSNRQIACVNLMSSIRRVEPALMNQTFSVIHEHINDDLKVVPVLLSADEITKRLDEWKVLKEKGLIPKRVSDDNKIKTTSDIKSILKRKHDYKTNNIKQVKIQENTKEAGPSGIIKQIQKNLTKSYKVKSDSDKENIQPASKKKALPRIIKDRFSSSKV